MMWTSSRSRLTALARGLSSIRSYAKKPSVIPSNQHKSNEHNDGDFRPPWVYSASHVLTYTLIPTAIVYCVFVADWGEREHVFTPVRRWALRTKESFFSLSPEEVSLVEGSRKSITEVPVTTDRRSS